MTDRRPLERIVVACCSIAVACAAAPAAARAGSGSAGDQSPLHLGGVHSSGSGVGAGAAFRVVAGLAIVLGVVYGVYWLLKAAARTRRPGTGSELNVLAQTVLAQGRALHLVRVGDELILVATSENAVAPVRVYEGDQAVRLAATLDEPLSPTAAQAPALSKLLDELRRRTAR